MLLEKERERCYWRSEAKVASVVRSKRNYKMIGRYISRCNVEAAKHVYI